MCDKFVSRHTLTVCVVIFLVIKCGSTQLLSSSGHCRFPGAPAHSTVAFANTSASLAGASQASDMPHGTVAQYQCERGFELLGPSRRACHNGRWVPEGIPFCVLNVAAGKAPMQISTEGTGVPQRAVDGSTSQRHDPATCSLTRPERVPWWYVNLLEPYMVQLVRLDFGKACCGPNKPATIVVRVGNNRPDLGTNPVCNRFTGSLEEGQPLFLPCNPPMPGAFVSVHLEVSQPAQLSICEAFVYTDQALPIERCPQFRDQPPGSTATYNGKCYSFYSRQPLAFREALAFCRSRGGTLVDESNPALQGFVSWELWRRHRSDSSSQYWMGAVRDQSDRANWKWLSGADVTVSFWNLPTGEQDCARFDGSKGWLWSDTDCDVPLNYICQHQPKACGRPEQPPNSTMISDRGFAVGASVSYACDEGHLLVGPSERTCLETGFYDEFPPVCKSIQCGFPAEIRRGTYSLLNDSVGYLSEVLYSCDPGSRMIGRARLTCDLDERWNGPPPRCEPTQCDRLPLVPHAIAEGTGRNVGDLVAYSCHRGYSIQGAQVLTCLDNGLWDRPVPECIEDLIIPESPIPAVTAYKPHPPRQTTPIITTGQTSRPTAARPTPTRPRPFSITPPTTTVRGQDSQERNPITSSSQPAQDVTRTNNNNRQYSNPPVRKPQSPLSVAPSNVLVVARPLDHEDTPVPGPDRLPANNRSEGPLGARLNLGAIVALGAFGGFVLLAAIVTTVVMLVRRNHSAKHYRHRASPDCNTVASFDSSSSESRNGLNRYYRQAWENLHESAGSKAGLKIQDRTAAAGVGGIHSPLRRKDTMDEPDGGNGFMNRNGGMQEKKRHHHHHHHHSSSTNGFRQEPHIVANSRREHREHSHKRY